MSKSDKELADSLDAYDRLIARGYKRVSCDKCKGIGYARDSFHNWGIPCSSCEGRGFHWEAPLMKNAEVLG